MSGGKWQYLATQIGYVASDLDALIVLEERKNEADRFRPETLQRFREGAQALYRAAVYERRIDWLLSYDDGEESFHRRLAEDLAKLEAETPTRGVPVAVTTAIIKAIEKGCKPRQAVLMQHHYNALLRAVGDILAYNEGLSDA